MKLGIFGLKETVGNFNLDTRQLSSYLEKLLDDGLYVGYEVYEELWDAEEGWYDELESSGEVLVKVEDIVKKLTVKYGGTVSGRTVEDVVDKVYRVVVDAIGDKVRPRISDLLPIEKFSVVTYVDAGRLGEFEDEEEFESVFKERLKKEIENGKLVVTQS